MSEATAAGMGFEVVAGWTPPETYVRRIPAYRISGVAKCQAMGISGVSGSCSK